MDVFRDAIQAKQDDCILATPTKIGLGFTTQRPSDNETTSSPIRHQDIPFQFQLVPPSSLLFHEFEVLNLRLEAIAIRGFPGSIVVLRHPALRRSRSRSRLSPQVGDVVSAAEAGERDLVLGEVCEFYEVSSAGLFLDGFCVFFGYEIERNTGEKKNQERSERRMKNGWNRMDMADGDVET